MRSSSSSRLTVGDPAELSTAEVEKTVKLAKAIVASVINDTDFPLESVGGEDAERVVMMAQVLTAPEVLELIACINWNRS